MPSQKSRGRGAPGGTGSGELDFVVDVTSFTEDGFAGTSGYEGKTVDLRFDEGEEGLFLSPEMAERLGAKKGDLMAVVVEDDATAIVRMRIAAVGARVRISDPMVYHLVGGEGGAIIRIRRD